MLTATSTFQVTVEYSIALTIKRQLLWTYGNGGEGNNTLSGLATPWGRYPIFTSVIADGKVFLDTTEHSPNSPLYKGALLRSINANTGAELWTIMNYGDNMYGGAYPVASGYLVALNTYNSQLYSYGQGPSQLTVTAPDTAATLGTPLVIRGTLMDIATGTKQNEQAARFPNGVPAVSMLVKAHGWSTYTCRSLAQQTLQELQ